MEERLSRLNALMGEAKRATLYLALLLLGVIVFFLFLGAPYAALLGGLTLLCYLAFLRPAQQKYRLAAQEARLLASAKTLEEPAFCRESPFTAEAVCSRGLIPMNAAGAMLRYGLTGGAEPFRATLGDLSCVYTFSTGGRRAATFSGCLAELARTEDAGVTCVFCPRQLLPEETLTAFYAAQGLQQRPIPSEGLLLYEDPARPISDETLRSALPALSALGDVALRVDEQGVFALVMHRFLNLGEPDLKRPWTEERLREDALPWLPGFLEAARTFDFDPKESEENQNGNA